MISLVCNLDSRPGIDGCTGGEMGNGSRSWDFFLHGICNKRSFLSGLGPIETIIFVDEHQPVSDYILESLYKLGGKIVLSPHNPADKNDARYVAALRLATGEYVAHFDQDVCAYGDASKWIEPVLTQTYKFVSYPCASSPDPDPDRKRWKHFRWASTRAFFCKREDLRLDDLEKCLADQQWAYQNFGTPPNCCPWTEHYLGLMAGINQVYYPPINKDFMIWSWSKYIAGVLPQLNRMTLPEVQDYVRRCGGISWSGELEARPI